MKTELVGVGAPPNFTSKVKSILEQAQNAANAVGQNGLSYPLDQSTPPPLTQAAIASQITGQVATIVAQTINPSVVNGATISGFISGAANLAACFAMANATYPNLPVELAGEMALSAPSQQNGKPYGAGALFAWFLTTVTDPSSQNDLGAAFMSAVETEMTSVGYAHTTIDPSGATTDSVQIAMWLDAFLFSADQIPASAFASSNSQPHTGPLPGNTSNTGSISLPTSTPMSTAPPTPTPISPFSPLYTGTLLPPKKTTPAPKTYTPVVTSPAPTSSYWWVAALAGAGAIGSVIAIRHKPA